MWYENGEDTKQNECETEQALNRPDRMNMKNRKKKCMRASYVCGLKFCGKTILKSYRHKWIFCHLYSSRISHRLRACRQNANIFFFTSPPSSFFFIQSKYFRKLLAFYIFVRVSLLLLTVHNKYVESAVFILIQLAFTG